MYHRMQVMQFWKKAERVMVYKRQSQLDARKKVAMDKHLSFLVGYLDILRHGTAVHALTAWLCCPLPETSKCAIWSLSAMCACCLERQGGCWHLVCTA